MSYNDPWMPHAYDSFVGRGMSEMTIKNMHQGIQRMHGQKIIEIFGWYREIQGKNAEEAECYLASRGAPPQLQFPFVQYTNMNFFWLSISQSGGEIPNGLAQQFNESFGSVSAFYRAFRGEAARSITPDWVWLVRKSDGQLDVMTSNHLRSPMTNKELLPLLCCSIAKHAYILDYGLNRDDYVMNWLYRVANFRYASARLGISA